MAEPSPNRHVAVAMEARKRQDWPAAIAAWRLALAMQPGHPGTMYGLAYDLARGDGSDALCEAQDLLEKAGRGMPDDPAPLVLLARIARRQGEPAAAADLLSRAVALRPDQESLRADLAGDLLTLRRHDQARELIDTLLAADPTSLRLLLLRARLARLAKDGTLGDRLARVLAVHPGHADAAREHAELLLAEGRADEARAVLDAVLVQHPRNPALWLALAHALVAGGHDEAARAAALRAAEAGPKEAQVTAIAQLLQALGRPGEAAAVAGTLATGSVSRLLTDAALARSRNDLDGALAACRAALALDPADQQAAMLLLRIHLNRKDPQAGLADLATLPAALRAGWPIRCVEARLREDAGLDGLSLLDPAADPPPDARALVVRATLLAQRGEPAAAHAVLDGIPPGAPGEVRHDREHTRVLLALDAHDPDAAAAALERAERAAPSPGALGGLRIRVRMLQGDYPAMLQAIREDVAEKTRSSNPVRRRAGERRSSTYRFVTAEIATDPWLAEEVRDACRLADRDARRARLTALVADHPAAFAPSHALLMELRRRGDLEWDAPGTGPQRIPRRILQFWDRQPPPAIAALMATWARHHPDWAMAVFDAAGATAWLQRNGPADAARAFAIARSPTLKSDLFRLAWLAAEGGLYADADDFCRGPLDALLAGAGLVLYQETIGSCGNNLIAAAPGDQLIKAALAEASANLLRASGREEAWCGTGPGLLTRCVARAHLPWLRDGAARPDLRILRLDQVRRHVRMCMPVAYKATAHWTTASR